MDQQLIIVSKKEIHKDNAEEMSINFVSSKKSMKLIKNTAVKIVPPM